MIGIQVQTRKKTNGCLSNIMDASCTFMFDWFNNWKITVLRIEK